MSKSSIHSAANPSASPARVTFVAVCLVLLFGAIASAFWYQDLRYSLPTPRPAQLTERAPGETIVLPKALEAMLAGPATQPIFLHFFNADCPCSRFNLDQIRDLYREHGAEARFVAIIQTNDPTKADELCTDTRNSLCGMTTMIDPDGEVAKSCGVYSTPQAVLLSAENRLLYRGNYNLSRYCTDRSTQFARLALEAALTRQPTPALPPAATLAYGCELPVFTTGKFSFFR